MNDFDLLIAGGGPVGLATAIAARQRGLSALVVERQPGIPEKACGEGLMPSALSALQGLGVDLARACELRGVRFIDGRTVASASFTGATGRALSRHALMRELRARADALGVGVLSEHTVLEFQHSQGSVRVLARAPRGRRLPLTGRLLVAADGLRSPIRRKLGYELPPLGAPRFGLQRHYACKPWCNWVEVHWHTRAEAYVTPLSCDEVGVAVLSHDRGLRHGEALNLFPELRERLSASDCGRLRGAGPLEQRARDVLAPGVALVGDAAGYLDALSGEGLAIGFRSAIALVERFAQGQLWAYPSDHAQLTAAYLGMTRLMLALARAPLCRHLAIRVLRARPGLFARLLRVVAELPELPELPERRVDTRPWRSLIGRALS